MEGLNYLCLAGGLSVVASLLGAAVFLPLLLGARAVTNKKYGKPREGLSVAVALIVAVSVACVFFYGQFAPAFPGYYQPQGRPNAADLVGEWVARADTLEHLAKLGYPLGTPSFEFHEDGTFSMVDVPHPYFGNGAHAMYSGQGTWRIVRGFQGYWELEVVFQTLSPPFYPDPPLSGPTPCPGKTVPCKGLTHDYGLWNRYAPFILIVDIPGYELEPDVYLTRLGDTHD